MIEIELRCTGPCTVPDTLKRELERFFEETGAWMLKAYPEPMTEEEFERWAND